MKKRILALVALMLCIVTVLASCATSKKFKKIVGDAAYEDENPTLAAAKALTLKGELENAKGDLVVFELENEEENTITYTVYNLALDTVVYTVTDSQKVEKTETEETTTEIEIELRYNEMTEASWFKVAMVTTVRTIRTAEESVSVVYSLRNAKGGAFAGCTTKDEKTVRFEESLDLILFENAAYRIAKDGSIDKAFDVNAFAAFPAVYYKQGNYYYGATSNYAICVYDAELNLVAHTQFPSYVNASDIGCFFLNDGNVLIQYTETLGQFEEEYDYSANGYRHNLCSFLLDVEKNKTKKLDLDYKIVRLDNQSEYDNWLYSEKIENVAWIHEIEDQKLDEAYSAKKMVSMSNKGKVKREITGIIPNQAPEDLKCVAPDRWVATDLAGNKFLLNGNGEIIGNVNGLDLENLNAFYLLMNGKIYDWDLNLQYDLTANEVEISAEMNHGVLMAKKNGETFFYANGVVRTLINEDEAKDKMCKVILADGAASDVLFIISVEAKDGKVTDYIYNDLGNVVTSVKKDDVIFNPTNMLAFTADSNKAVLVCAKNAQGKTAYYRFG